MKLQFANYRRVFSHPSFRAFWTGFTLSVLGDAMSGVALTWYVFDQTGSARALGLLTLAYTGPVIFGGLAAGWLLDRFERRKVMLVDNLVRGLAMLLIPALFAAGRLELWHAYFVAAVYGSLMMISLAGGPALVPGLVEAESLDTANALETLSFTLSGVIGPPVAGLLIPLIGVPYVILVDAISYFLFAAALSRVKSSRGAVQAPGQAKPQTIRLSDAARLLLTDQVLLSTTLMFMAFNLGYGFLTVWLPVYSDRIAGGGPELYGGLLGVMALGQIISAALAGSLSAAGTSGRADSPGPNGRRDRPGDSSLRGPALAAVHRAVPARLLQHAADHLGANAAHADHPRGPARPRLRPAAHLDAGDDAAGGRGSRVSPAGYWLRQHDRLVSRLDRRARPRRPEGERARARQAAPRNLHPAWPKINHHGR